MKCEEAWARDYPVNAENARSTDMETRVQAQCRRTIYYLGYSAAIAEAVRVVEPYLRDEGSHKVSEIAEEIKRRIEEG